MSARPAGLPLLALLASNSEDTPLATQLARDLALPLAPAGTDPADCHDFDALLMVSGPSLALQQTGRQANLRQANLRQANLRQANLRQANRRGTSRRRPVGGTLPGPVSVDFGSDDMRHRRRSGHNELLGKAVGVSPARHLHVLDATAGLGRDGFILADMGCEVTLCERELVIATLLSHGLQAALASGDGWLEQVARRLNLVTGDAGVLAQEKLAAVDVIYLDPMFPLREKSAAVKKEMALFQLLLNDDSAAQDAERLLLWALTRDVARVVVKRPVRAPFIAQRKPSHSVAGKAVRFDVYVLRPLA